MLLARFRTTAFQDTPFRLLSRLVLPGEDPESVYLDMFLAPMLETGDSQPMIHTTGSYLYDLDRLIEERDRENDLIHGNLYYSVEYT